jgi:uncharacterized delta-60 repeat protein
MLGGTRKRIIGKGFAAAAAALALWAASALAFPGQLDTGFSGDGKTTTSFGGVVDGGNAVAIQADGKIVVAGGEDLSGGFAIARYNADGTLDNTFDGDSGTGNGKVVIESVPGGGFSEALAVAIQSSDQKIVVAGYGFNDDPSDGSDDWALARLNTDGTLDDSTDPTPGTNFSTDGTLLTQFATGPDDFSYNNDHAQAVGVQADGDIVAAGYGDPTINDPNGDGEEDESDFAVARYDSNGALDAGFGGDGKVTEDLRPTDSYDLGNGLALLPGNKVLVVGMAQLNPNETGDHTQGLALAQFESDGDLDATFGTSNHPGIRILNFTTVPEQFRAVVRQPDGRIVAAGSYNDTLLVARFTAAGLDDLSFGNDTNTSTTRTTWNSSACCEAWNGVALQADGKILTGGTTDPSGVGSDFLVGRFLANGAVDHTWDRRCNGATRTDFGDSDAAQGIALDANGKLVTAGYAGVDFALARFLTAGGPADCTVPNTTIKGPRKTRKRRPTYRLISTEAGSHFTCRINGRGTSKPFFPCTSPFKMPRLKLGPTRFEARAIDAAGNVDQSPAFLKIKRIRRRR